MRVLIIEVMVVGYMGPIHRKPTCLGYDIYLQFQ